MDAKFHIKRADLEIELSGPVPFVEGLLQAHLASWLGSDSAPQTVSGTPSAISPAAPSPPSESAPDFPRVSPLFQPKVNVSLAEFTRMKEAVSPCDILVVAAYYFEKYRRQESFKPSELQEALAALPAWECHEAETEIELPLTLGYLERLRDGRYTLTFKGQNYVRDGLA
jgi:hypothetical protein